jgi:superoxide reductase
MKRTSIFKCSVCGNIVELVHVGGGTLVCCGKNMELLNEKTSDAGAEKHVPVIVMSEKEIVVKVGSIPHPMEEEHFIEWIELVADGVTYRKFLKPGDQPEASFTVTGKQLSAREYCTVHGLWKKE